MSLMTLRGLEHLLAADFVIVFGRVSYWRSIRLNTSLCIDLEIRLLHIWYNVLRYSCSK